jgi:hypothetical protein
MESGTRSTSSARAGAQQLEARARGITHNLAHVDGCGCKDGIWRSMKKKKWAGVVQELK